MLFLFKHEEKINIAEKTFHTIVVDLHGNEIVTINSVIETNVREEGDIIEITEDSETVEQEHAISGKEYANRTDYNSMCKMCDFASARKTSLKNHQKTIHHWCFIGFSSYTCQENMKDHFSNAHSTNQEDLDLALGKTP